ncbi:HSP20-like chaperone [Gongronella butleri]|nr:HSP20-like chaperone [Gongronella butleri]
MPLHPTITWAQRAEFLYLTVNLADITNPQINLTSDKFTFKAKAEKEQNEYECEIEFSAPIDVEKSRQVLTPRNLFMVIYKQSEGWWDKLYKGSKLNFVKTDFARWADEDDEVEAEPQNPMDMMNGGGLDFSQFMNAPGLGDMGAEAEASDDDEDDDDVEHPTSTIEL